MSISDQLSLLPGFVGGRGADVSSVEDAQKILGLLFSADYRSYLLAFGTMLCEGHELTGISSSARVDVVSVTQRARELEPQVPDDLYVIEDAAIDGILIWQDRKGTVWQTLPGRCPERIADSLIDYLKEG